jgi:glycosyltransferase involved in cell wall biosynthesis
LPAFDLYALNSRREACPVGMIEACAARLPIVASEIGGIPEIIANGKSGILVPPDDSDELASAISLLMRDPAKAAQFGTEARQNFLDKFTLDKMIDATLAVYRKEIA